MSDRKDFEIVCPNDHGQTVTFSRKKFEEALKSGAGFPSSNARPRVGLLPTKILRGFENSSRRIEGGKCGAEASRRLKSAPHLAPVLPAEGGQVECFVMLPPHSQLRHHQGAVHNCSIAIAFTNGAARAEIPRHVSCAKALNESVSIWRRS